MADLQWALTCRDVSIDSSTNNITYRDAVEQFRIPDFPADIPNLFFVSVLWRRDDLSSSESLEFRIILEDHDREEQASTHPLEIDLEDNERFRAQVENPPLTIEEPGTIWFCIEKNEGQEWERVKSLPVEVKEINSDVPEAVRVNEDA